MARKTLPILVPRPKAGACAAGSASARKQLQTGREPRFENEQVRVWTSVIRPHTPLPLHRYDHPSVLIALTGGTMQVADEGGPAETQEWKTGKAYWLPANAPGTRHQDINVGKAPIEGMVVELQKAD